MSGRPADGSRPISALEVAVSTLREQLAAANGRAERAEERADAEREGRLNAAARADRAETRADRAQQAVSIEQDRAGALRKQVQGLLTQLATVEADAKAANDRAWVSGEAAGALREQIARMEQRIEAEPARGDRAESGPPTRDRISSTQRAKLGGNWKRCGCSSPPGSNSSGRQRRSDRPTTPGAHSAAGRGSS
jgi:chromosome segregation ATPase